MRQNLIFSIAACSAILIGCHHVTIFAACPSRIFFVRAAIAWSCICCSDSGAP